MSQFMRALAIEVRCESCGSTTSLDSTVALEADEIVCRCGHPQAIHIDDMLRLPRRYSFSRQREAAPA